MSTLLVIHIPRTGGTSILGCLQSLSVLRPVTRNLAVYNPWIYQGEGWFERLSGKDRGSFKAIFGHFPYGLHEGVEGECRYAVCLRNPKDRMKSHVRYAFVRNEHDRAWLSMNPDVGEWIRERNCLELQSQFVCGTADTGKGATIPDAATIREALVRMKDENWIVGFTDRLQDYVNRICGHLGVDPVKVGHENASPAPDKAVPITPGGEGLGDTMLYREALQVFG